MQEIWKDIKDYEGLYQISNLGRIKSLCRIVYNAGVNDSIKLKEKFLKINYDKDGYCTVNLNKKGCHKRFKIHRLVAIAFILNTDNKNIVNHIDSNRSNNNIKNLEWVTVKENVSHSLKYGNRDLSLLHSSNKKLSLKDVKYIRLNKNIKAKALAKKFKVTNKCIYSIRTFKTWKNEL